MMIAEKEKNNQGGIHAIRENIIKNKFQSLQSSKNSSPRRRPGSRAYVTTCKSWIPAFAEMTVLIDSGLRGFVAIKEKRHSGRAQRDPESRNIK